MRFFSDKKYNKIFGYCFAFVLVTLLAVLIIFKWDNARAIFSSVLTVISPLIWGAVIAFVMNPMMKNCEKFLARFIFKKKPHPKIARAIGIIFASIVIVAVIAVVILTIIPQLITNIPGIYDGITNEFIPSAQSWVNKILDDNPSIATVVNNEIDNIMTNLKDLINGLAPQLKNLLTSLLSFANSVKSFVLGFIVAIYFLFSKEKLQAQAKQMIVAMFSERTYHKIFSITSNTNHALLNFVYGKIIDSVIIGILCAIVMFILKMPYAMIISLIIGITNIIPIFGPFIGAIPSAILVLIAEPNKVIIFIIFIFALQQLDGNVIGPKILGDKVGLSSFWVLISILICGSMFGIAGMIIGVPLFAVLIDLITNIVESRLKEKNMPTEQEYYSMAGVNIGRVTDSEPDAEVLELTSADNANSESSSDTAKVSKKPKSNNQRK